MIRHRVCLLGFVLLLSIKSLHCQQATDSLGFFKPAQIYSPSRFYTALGIGAGAYTLGSITLYNAWYKDYPKSTFHLFNDWGEWENLDKAGHMYAGYFQTLYAYKVGRWTGISENKALLTGAITGGLFQTTLEVMDGFNAEWGFSIPDFGANILGISAFLVQQKMWGEQRISFKHSSFARKYDDVVISGNCPTCTTTLQSRVEGLYGTSWLERSLKDYNFHTYWLSFNVKSFFPESSWPSWLNLAAGYGASNMFGGFDNKWASAGGYYEYLPNERRKQFYFSVDLDLERMGVKNPFLKTIFTMLNVRKIPTPAVELDSQGNWFFHFLHF